MKLMDFATGMTVYLNSGSPALTVREIRRIGDQGQIEVAWFDGLQCQAATLPAECLSADQNHSWSATASVARIQ